MINGFNKLINETNFIKEFIKEQVKKWFAFSRMERESFGMMRKVN